MGVDNCSSGGAPAQARSERRQEQLWRGEGAGREEDARSLQIFASRCGTVCSGYHVTRDANTPSRDTIPSSAHCRNTTRRITFSMSSSPLDTCTGKSECSEPGGSSGCGCEAVHITRQHNSCSARYCTYLLDTIITTLR